MLFWHLSSCSYAVNSVGQEIFPTWSISLWPLGNTCDLNNILVKCAIYSQGKTDFLLIKNSKYFRASYGRRDLTILLRCSWRHAVVLVFCRGLMGWNTWLALVKRY